MNRGATLLVALLVATSAVTMAVAAGATTSTTDAGSSTTAQSEADAYAGAHVQFDVQGDAITNYSVDGERSFSSVAVQSQSEAETGGGLDASTDLEAATDLNGAGLSLATQTRTSAEIRADSGATLSAHDNRHGTLVVESGDEAQYVEAELGADAEAREDGDRVVVDTDSREGAVFVIGDGEVGVTDDGNVTAELSENATLAFRSYEDAERDKAAQYEESLIAEGNAAVEVTADHRDGETVTDAVTYGQETSADVATSAEGQVEMTINRTVHDGTVVVTTVSEEAVGSLENVSVTVDGEAALEASSKSELEGAIGSDQSQYMVVQDATAEGQATVYIGVNHFSERTATIDGASAQDDETTESDDSDSDTTEGDDSDNETTDDETTDSETESDSDESEADGGSDDSVPGFGVGATLVALLIGVGARARR